MSFTAKDLERIQGYKKDYRVVSKPVAIADRPRTEPQGTLMKTLDYITRPLYASAGFSNAIVQGKSMGQALGSAAKGFAGEERIFYSDVLKNAGVKNKYARAVGGFALDVGLDPLTYLTFGVGAGAKLGMTTLNKSGRVFLNRTLTRQLPKLTKLNMAKGVSKKTAEQMARESIEEGVLRMSLKQPEKYVAQSAIRLLGKKVPIVSDMWKYSGKKVSPTLEKFKRVGPSRWVGEHFIGENYIIKHAKNLTPLQKNLSLLHLQQFKTRTLLGGELALQKSLQMAKEVPNFKDRELIANAIEQAGRKIKVKKDIQVSELADFVVGDRKVFEKLARKEFELGQRVSRASRREPFVDVARREKSILRGKEEFLARLRSETGFGLSATRALKRMGFAEAESHLLSKAELAVPRDQVDNIARFMDSVGDNLFDDVGLSILKAGGKQGQFDYGKTLVSLYKKNILRSGGRFDKATVHELWHSLSRYLPDKDVIAFKNSFNRGVKSYIKKNKWFEEIFDFDKGAVKDFLREKETKLLFKKFPEAEKHFTKIIDKYGQKEWHFNFDNNTYKLKNVDEWFAENLAEKTFQKFTEMDTITKSIFAHSKKIFWDMIHGVQRLFGRDVVGKSFDDFFKQRNIMQVREAGLGVGKVFLKKDMSTKAELAALLPKHLVSKAEDVERFIFKEITEPEARKGLVQSFKQGYMPHYYKNKLAGVLSKDIPHPIIAKNKSGRVRIFETMEEAAEKGWQPIEDYAVSVGLRNAYSKKIIAVDDYVQKTLSNVATPISKKSTVWKSMMKTQRVPEGMGLYMPRSGARFYPLYNSGKTKEVQSSVAKSMKKLFDKEGTGGFYGGELLKDIRLTPVQSAFKISDDIPVYLMPKEIADMMNAASPYLTTEKGMGSMLKFYDQALNMWKTSVTVWFPGFHARNAMSNAWLAFLGGLKNPLRIKEALQLQRYDYMVSRGKPAKDFVIKLHGKNYKASELVRLGRESGVLSRGWFGAEVGDTIEKQIMLKTGIRPRLIGEQAKVRELARNIVIEKPRAVGTAVENNARFALFLDQMNKGIDVGSAARHTKKFLFDYGELTQFEKKTMKRVVPFYSWIKKNIPLEVEQLLAQPSKFALAGKSKGEIESLSERPDEKYLPEWMREKEMFVRLPYESPDKPSYMNFDFAFQDLSKLSANPSVLREWWASLAPPLKMPFEILANHNMYFGREIVDENLPKEIKFRESIKESLMNNMRITGYAKKLTKKDLKFTDWLLDAVLGLKAYPYDEAKSKYYYYQRKQREQRALRKYQLKKKKK